MKSRGHDPHGDQILDEVFAGATLSSDGTGFPPAPSPLRDAALHGLPGAFVRTVEPHSESDPAALLLQFLVGFGNACGRGPSFRVEGDEHGTNENVALVGPTGRGGRKGSALGQVRRVFRQVDPDWESQCIGSGIASGEGLIHAVRDRRVARRAPRNKEERERADADGRIEEEVDPGVDEKRLLVVEPELAQTLRVMNKEGSTVSAILRKLWESGNARNLSKTSPEKTTGSLVSLIGHITPRELRKELTDSEAANGFGNRWLWVCVRRSKKLPRGGDLPEEEVRKLAQRIRDAVGFASRQGLIGMTEEAWEVWESFYELLDDSRDDLLAAVTARAESHTRRLAMLYALLDKQPIVGVEHLHAAIAVWDYCEQSAGHIFGGKAGDPLTDKILDGIRQAGAAGLTRTTIRDLVGGHVPAEEIDRALSWLLLRGLIEEHHDPTTPKGGRRAHRYTPGGRSKPREGSEETSKDGGFAPKGDEVSSGSQGSADEVEAFEQRLEAKRRESRR